jgi:hypothetical protein
VRQVKYRDVTRTHYVRHINRIVTVTQVQPVVRVHTVTRVHHEIIARVHTRVIPRVHVVVIPRIHTRTVVLNQNQYVSETRMLPTRTAMAGSRTVMAGTTRVASNGKMKSSRIASGGELIQHGQVAKIWSVAADDRLSLMARYSSRFLRLRSHSARL